MTEGRKIKRIERDYIQELLDGKLAICNSGEKNSWTMISDIIHRATPKCNYAINKGDMWVAYSAEKNLWYGLIGYSGRSIGVKKIWNLLWKGGK